MPEMTTLPSLHNWSMILDQALSGEQGTNREIDTKCQLKARNDYEAVQCWLHEYQHKATTYRTYQKESDRFLLWSIFERGKALSSLDRDDVEAYLNFLDDPQPRKWCGTKTGRGCKRGDPNWRPFAGALSHSAKMTAISAIDSLFNNLFCLHF